METNQGESHNNQIFSYFLLHFQKLRSVFQVVCSGTWVQTRHALLVMSEQLLAEMEFSIKLWKGSHTTTANIL